MKELILLGGGGSRIDCPYDAEVWTTSTVLLQPETKLESISKVFAIDVYPQVRDSLTIAQKHNIPIISTRDYATEPYPWKEIIATFKSKYFRNTMSYMLAMAIYKAYEKLRLYGVDQGPDYDYIANKPYVMYWLGVATGRGIEFEVPKSGLLFDPLMSAIKKQLEDDMKRARQWLDTPGNKEKLVAIGQPAKRKLWLPSS